MPSKARRVLVLNHFAAPLGHAGGTRHVELFSKLEGWDHLIIAANRNYLTGETVDIQRGFSTVVVPRSMSSGLSRVLSWLSYSLLVVAKAFTVGKVDVVYASSPHLLAGLSGWAISLQKRCPFVLEIRDLWPRVLIDMGQLHEQSQTYRLLMRLEMFLYRRAHRIVVMAEGSKDDLIARGVSPSKFAYIPNGADADMFVPSGSTELLREKYGFTRFTAVYAGAHGPANGLDLLLVAAEATRDCPLDIVLLGGGTCKAALIKSASDKSLTNVRFLNPVPKTEMPDVLAAADVGLHVLADVPLFHSAVSPNKVFDYMAAGLPVLTNCPGLVAELIHKARSGTAVGPDGLADGLRYVLTLPEQHMRRMGNSGRHWLLENQSRQAMAGRLELLLNNVITAKRKPNRKDLPN